jgi:DNA polymerase V
MTKTKKSQKMPLFFSSIKAGFLSPADDFIDKQLDLNEYLVKNPAATFFVKVSGDSMIDAGIFTDDILIIDRSIEPDDKKIIIAIVDGEFTVKRFCKKGSQIYLIPENKNYKPIKITQDMDFQVWGVVTNVIHKL